MDAGETLDYGTFLTKHAPCLRTKSPTLWVFGYGSLLWKPDFEFNSYKIGYVENYERKFNQGNETFRGTKDKLGRVANLEETQGGKVWGLAYEICGRDCITKVLQNLFIREIAKGGYKVTTTTFHPRKCRGSNSSTNKCCTENYHNIPLPHPACGLPQTNQSEKTESPIRPNSSCWSWQKRSFNDYRLQHSVLPSCQASKHDCPCLFGKDLKDTSIQYSYPKCNERNPLQTLETGNFSHISNNISETSSENTLLHRKTSHDFVNHTKQFDPILSKNYQNRTLDSGLFSQNNISTHHESNIPNSTPIFQGPQSQVHLDVTGTEMSDNESCISVLLFTVTKTNCLYLGPDNVSKMASQIVGAKGTAGSNVEYVLKIADFIKTFIPEDEDRLLFQLDDKIKEELFSREVTGNISDMVETNLGTRRVNS